MDTEEENERHSLMQILTWDKEFLMVFRCYIVGDRDVDARFGVLDVIL